MGLSKPHIRGTLYYGAGLIVGLNRPHYGLEPPLCKAAALLKPCPLAWSLFVPSRHNKGPCKWGLMKARAVPLDGPISCANWWDLCGPNRPI